MAHAVRPELQLGNIFVRPNLLDKKGDRIHGHQHNFSHATFFVRGSFRVIARRVRRSYKCECGFTQESVRLLSTCHECGRACPTVMDRHVTLLDDRTFVAGQVCLILADVEHEIIAEEDGSEFACIYSHRDPQGRVTEHYTGWSQAYV